MLSKKALIEYQKLKKSYRESLNTKRQNLEELWQAVSEGKGDETDLHNLRLLVHRLAGSATSYGYEIISDTARKAEKLIIEQIHTYSTESIHPKMWLHNRTDLHSAVTQLISALNAANEQKDTG